MKKRWTTRHLPNMAGKVVLVTGATGGLGSVTCRELAAAGAHVVMACRNPDKAATAASTIRQQHPDASLEIMPLELASLASIRRLAEEFATCHDQLDVLINNAGIIGQPKRYTEDGFESQIGVDFLGHFALTGLLLDRLRQSPAARVIAVGSAGWMHRHARIRLTDPNWKRGHYRKLAATGQAKLALQIFSIELHRRLETHRESIISMAVHPGVADTDVSLTGYDATGAHLKKRLMQSTNHWLAQSANRGALPTLYAAAAPGVHGGDFYGPSGLLELRGYPAPVKAGSNARSRTVATKLWTLGEELTGVRYLS